VVCDACNNYFAVKIENPLLSSFFFTQLRARNLIESKKGNLRVEQGWMLQKEFMKEEIEVEFHRHPKRTPALMIPQPFASLMLHADPKKVLITTRQYDEPPISDKNVSRLLGKIGIEVIAQRALENDVSLDLLIDDEVLDPIRNYARFNRGPHCWPYYVRRVYGETDEFLYAHDPTRSVDVLYQYNLFAINQELFLVIILKGYEFAINVFSQSIEPYIRKTIESGGKSLLHDGYIIQQGQHRD
jgi:hypothetical protein